MITDRAPVVGTQVLTGGRSLWNVAAIAGQTPFYVYDFGLIELRIAHLRAVLPPGLDLHYAMKANPLPGLVQRIAPLVDGLDVASLRELQLALGTGIAPGDISFAGPGKKDHELAAALAARVTINVESIGELARLEGRQTSAHQPARVALRVNPDFHVRGSGMGMGGGSQQFGIDAECIPDVAAAVRRSRLVGLHVFAGSQNLKLEALTQAVTRTFALAASLFARLGVEPEYLNLGGGLGIPYFAGDQPLDLAGYAAHLTREALAWHERFPACRLILELGRYLVGEAGMFVTRVIDKKVSRGKTFLVVDGGLHHHLAASGNFGQVIPRNYPISVVPKHEACQRLETVTVVGPLCTPLDTLGRDVELPACEVGDLVVVHQSGAYGPSASPINFLSHPAPVELVM
jgi:diaminopimelate decarboxylase